MMKHVINKIFNFLGFTIHRVRKTEIFKPSPNGKPIFIEFVGLSGVGKSTLFSEIKKKRNHWLTISDFMKIHRDKRVDTLLDDSLFYQKIATYRMWAIQQIDTLPADKFRIAHWNYSTLIEDAMVNKFNTHYTIVTEEGLFHNFGDGIEDLYYTDKETFHEKIKNRAIIYCYARPEVIVKQIMERQQKTGRIVVHHKKKSFEELVRIQEKELKEKQDFINLLSENNVPVLSVNIEEGIQPNAEKIHSFIEKLQTKQD